MKSTVSEKGQVTIPKALRESLALTAGAQLEFREEAGKLVAERLPQRGRLEGLISLLPRIDVEEALTDLRGPGWRQDLDRG